MFDDIHAGPSRADVAAFAEAFVLFPFAPDRAWYERYWYVAIDPPHCPRRLRCGVGRLRRRVIAAVHLAPPPPQCPAALPLWAGPPGR